MGFLDKLKNGLSKTKNSFDEKINNVFSNFRKVDEELLEELEEALIMSDVGAQTSTKIISNLRDRIKKEKIENEEDVRNALREEIKAIREEQKKDKDLDKDELKKEKPEKYKTTKHKQPKSKKKKSKERG